MKGKQLLKEIKNLEQKIENTLMEHPEYKRELVRTLRLLINMATGSVKPIKKGETIILSKKKKTVCVDFNTDFKR